MTWLAALVALALVAPGCRPRPEGSVARLTGEGEAPAPTTGPLAAEDLAILLPIGGWDQDVAGLAGELLPLSQVLGADVYSQIMNQIVSYPGDDAERSPNPFHPAQNAGLAAIRNGIPLAEWYVTGIRFIPCQTPAWPLPRAWMKGLADAFCLPRVRLSAQRFGKVGNALTSDDKALHLTFAYASAERVKQEEQAAASLQKLMGGGVTAEEAKLAGQATATVLTAAQAQDVVAATLVPGDGEARTRLLAFVNKVKGDASTGSLRIRPPGELRERDARLRDLLPDELKRHAVLQRITFNFASTGTQVGFNQTWTMGSFAVSDGSPRAERLVFLGDLTLVKAADQSRYPLARLIDRGFRESFTDNSGSKSSLDPELLSSLNAARKVGERAVPPLLRDLLRLTGSVQFAQVGGANVSAEAVDQASAFASLHDEADLSYKLIQDPALNDRQSSCLSCHVTGALRKVFDLAASKGVVKDPANMNTSLRGPGGVGQIEFSQQWVLRALGYLGRMPCINDRLAAEVEADLAQISAL